MKRIISLLLAIVMTAGLLVSCGYSFAEDDMSLYADFNLEDFKALLGEIKIEDADFTADDDIRAKKHLDTIYEALTKEAVAKTEGKMGAYDMFKYCYYITCDLNKDGTITPDETFKTDKMAGSAPTEIQVGLNDVEADSLAAKLYEAFKDFEFKGTTEEGEGSEKTKVPGVNYETVAKETKAKVGDTVFVTYTVTYVAKNGEEIASKETKVTYTKKLMVLTEGDTLSSKFVDTVAGATVSDFTLADEVNTKDGYHYTGVKLDWIVTAGQASEKTVTVKYTDSATVKSVETTKEAVSLKDKEVTYHVFPSGFEDTPELAWELIMVDIFGNSVKSSLLECFEDENVKDSDGVTLKQYIDGDEDKELAALANLIYAKESATATSDKAAKDEGKKTAAELLEERMVKIRALVTATEGLADKVVTEYKDFVYENLVNQYNNEIRTLIATEIEKLIDKSVTIKSLPEKAVDEVFDILMQNHEYTFHTGSSKVDGKTVSYYTQYKGSFDAYLIGAYTEDGKAPANVDEAEAKVLAEAEDFVSYIVKLYTVAEAYDRAGDYDLVIGDKEYKEMTYDDPYYERNVSSYGDIGVRTAYQFERLFNELIIIEGEQDAIDEYEAKVEAGDEEAEYDFDIVYKDGFIDFVHVKYSFKTPEEK